MVAMAKPYIVFAIATVDFHAGKSRKLIFTITDTGVGIPKNKLQAIFKPFVQGQSYDTRNYGGVGLGLSIVHSLIKEHQGEIIVQSKLGRGTTFTILLPECSTQEEITIGAADGKNFIS